MKLIVPLFGQRDSRWFSKILGTGGTTIGDYGCLLTSIAMLAKYFGKDTDPDRLNTALIGVKGFLNGNLYKWYEGVTKVYSDIICTKIVYTPQPVTAAQFAEMRAELDAGRPVVLFVDFKPETAAVDMHFILLVAYELVNGKYSYFVHDPWWGDYSNLNRYGDPVKAIQQYVFHSGPIQVSDTIPVKKADFENLVTKATALDNQNPSYDILKQSKEDLINESKGLKVENGQYKDFVVASANKLGVPATTSGVLGAIESVVGVEDLLRKERDKTEQLTTQLGEAQGTIQTKTEEIKLVTDENTKLTEDLVVETKKVTDLTEDKRIVKEELEKLKINIGSPGQFTRSVVINYLLNNLFNKEAWAKE